MAKTVISADAVPREFKKQRTCITCILVYSKSTRSPCASQVCSMPLGEFVCIKELHKEGVTATVEVCRQNNKDHGQIIHSYNTVRTETTDYLRDRF